MNIWNRKCEILIAIPPEVTITNKTRFTENEQFGKDNEYFSFIV